MVQTKTEYFRLVRADRTDIVVNNAGIGSDILVDSAGTAGRVSPPLPRDCSAGAAGGSRDTYVSTPLLTLQPQHAFQANRRAAIAGLRVEWLDQGAEFAPWCYLVHFSQELRTRRVCLLCLSKLSLARVACRISACSAVAASLLQIDP